MDKSFVNAEDETMRFVYCDEDLASALESRQELQDLIKVVNISFIEEEILNEGKETENNKDNKENKKKKKKGHHRRDQSSSSLNNDPSCGSNICKGICIIF